MNVLCDTTDHVGPLAASCRDAAICLAAIAGPHLSDRNTAGAPPPLAYEEVLAALEAGGGAARRRIGVPRRLFSDPMVDARVAVALDRAAATLEEQGAALYEIELPDLELSRALVLIMVAVEGLACVDAVFPGQRHRLGYDLQVLAALGARVPAHDYLAALRLRREIGRRWRRLFESLDFVVMPATLAPAEPLEEAALASGELDELASIRATACLMPQNATGYPALALPCGSADGLPLAVQIVAPPWRELELLAVGAELERAGMCDQRRPRRYYR
jgi:Asp-tRNA(Asn)/Glu-tRNA(Gln) amidotransferase A subunit family amidase